jgi:FtsP/CotA-like multicopper oxidase with cupredoxin domain
MPAVLAIIFAGLTGVAPPVLAAAPEVETHKHPMPVYKDVTVNPYSTPDLSTPQNLSLKATGKVREYTLTIEQIRWNVVGNVYMTQWAFNGQVPGPTLEANEGDLVRITVKNNTSVDHTLHAHGLWAPTVMDGVPDMTQKPIGPGQSFLYEFVAKPAGFHWYHCHVNTAEHLEMGLYGGFIVHPAPQPGLGTSKEQALDPSLKIDRDYILIIDEMDTRIEEGKAGGLGLGHPRMIANYNYFTINGKAFPDTPVLWVREGETIRIRILNVGSWVHSFHLHGHTFATSSAECDRCPRTWEYRDVVNVSTAQRVDIVFKANNPGRWMFHCHIPPHVTNNGAYPGGMMTIVEYENNPYEKMLPPMNMPGLKASEDHGGAHTAQAAAEAVKTP